MDKPHTHLRFVICIFPQNKKSRDEASMQLSCGFDEV
jgi:hypothetical protein